MSNNMSFRSDSDSVSPPIILNTTNTLSLRIYEARWSSPLRHVRLSKYKNGRVLNKHMVHILKGTI